MTQVQKNEIISLIETEITRLGSANRVANKCGVSAATISQMRSGKYEELTDQIWVKVANELGYSNDTWQMVETTNLRMMLKVLQDAKKESMFFALSDPAGTGKTATLRYYTETNITNAVYYIQCREWSKRDFLTNLCKQLGIDIAYKGFLKLDDLSDLVISFFQARRQQKPLLLIDEADKLKPAALRFLIPLYNMCEGFLGCVISGTDNLEKEIKKGVRFNAKGYDEIDSRFGRSFVHLIGNTMADVTKICTANGITAPESIKKVWQECEPKSRIFNNRNLNIITDLRRLKRIVQRELLILQQPEPATI